MTEWADNAVLMIAERDINAGHWRRFPSEEWIEFPEDLGEADLTWSNWVFGLMGLMACLGIITSGWIAGKDSEILIAGPNNGAMSLIRKAKSEQSLMVPLPEHIIMVTIDELPAQIIAEWGILAQAYTVGKLTQLQDSLVDALETSKRHA